MTAVALQCKVKNHHPEWSNVRPTSGLLSLFAPSNTSLSLVQVYNTVFIRWTTHSVKGLSALDAAMARACDGLAEDFGAQEDSERERDSPTTTATTTAHGGGGNGSHAADGGGGGVRCLVDRASDRAGDCCGSRKRP
jgi:4a-hydroxytetrahydrobiopterin dehydratase